MAIYGDKVRETSTTTGTETLDLAGAFTGFRTFVAGVGTGKATIYTIENRDVPSEWEVGLGVVTDATPDTLSRVIVLASSNSGSLVSFSAGTKNVFVSAGAYQLTSLQQLPRRVKQATTANITLSGEQTIDGVLSATSRILVKNQSTPAQNGIYTTAAGAWSRAVDCYTGDDASGQLVIVEQGTVAADTLWLCTTNSGSAVVGTNDLAYSQLAGSGISLLSPTITGTADIQGALKLSGDISPSQITASQNDYAPTGFSTASVMRLNSDAAWNITGLAGGADGRLIIIFNVGAFAITLKDADAASTAANRFAFTADFVMAVDEGCALLYDSTSSRWRCIGRVAVPGNMTGPGSSTDKQLAAFNGTGGDTLQVVPGATFETGGRVNFTALARTPFASSDGATITLDWTTGDIFDVTVAGNRTVAFTNPKVGQCILFHVKQDGTGSRTITWPATVQWGGGAAPTLTTTAGRTDTLGFECKTAGGSPAFYGRVVDLNVNI